MEGREFTSGRAGKRRTDSLRNTNPCFLQVVLKDGLKGESEGVKQARSALCSMQAWDQNDVQIFFGLLCVGKRGAICAEKILKSSYNTTFTIS